MPELEAHNYNNVNTDGAFHGTWTQDSKTWIMLQERWEHVHCHALPWRCGVLSQVTTSSGLPQ